MEGWQRDREQGLRAVQLEGKNMDWVLCVFVWEGEREVERSGEDLGNKRTVSGVCRGAEATHECLRLPLTRTQTRACAHSTLSIIHISQRADADSTPLQLQQSTQR